MDVDARTKRKADLEKQIQATEKEMQEAKRRQTEQIQHMQSFTETYDRALEQLMAAKTPKVCNNLVEYVLTHEWM